MLHKDAPMLVFTHIYNVSSIVNRELRIQSRGRLIKELAHRACLNMQEDG